MGDQGKELKLKRRRALRHDQTDAENKLWSKLRNRQLFGYKVRRQHSIGPYVADFYCPKAKLVIEIDGGQHFTEEGLLHDKKRTDYLVSCGVRVIRFDNIQILRSIDKVIEQIIKELKSKVPPHLSSPS